VATASSRQEKDSSRRRLGVDNTIAVLSLITSAVLAVALAFVTLAGDKFDRRRQEAVDRAQAEAGFLEACLAFETFVIEQHRQGLTERQISRIVPTDTFLMQTAFDQTEQCPGVGEILNALNQD
jgi:hypothetical protein